MPPTKKTKPNEKCPCGSGKKHKKCCMVAAMVAASSAPPPPPTATAVLDEMMAALTLNITTASATDMSACSHGSTSTHLPDGRAYSDVIQEYLTLPDRAGREQFEQEHRDYLKDLKFTQYVFALCTSWYLKLNGTTREMKLILHLAVDIKYLEGWSERSDDLPDHDKLTRYSRAIWNNDDRGVINCLSRETRFFCNCMDEKKTEADGMEKTDKCFGCKHSFPRSFMKKCSGCQFAMFCKTEGCYDEYWPTHRKGCKELQQELLEKKQLQRALQKQEALLREMEEKQQALLDELEEKQRALPREPKDSHK